MVIVVDVLSGRGGSVNPWGFSHSLALLPQMLNQKYTCGHARSSLTPDRYKRRTSFSQEVVVWLGPSLTPFIMPRLWMTIRCCVAMVATARCFTEHLRLRVDDFSLTLLHERTFSVKESVETREGV